MAITAPKRSAVILSGTSTPSNTAFSNDHINYNSRRIKKAFVFMHESYDKELALTDVAKLINMTEVSSSQFIKNERTKISGTSTHACT